MGANSPTFEIEWSLKQRKYTYEKYPAATYNLFSVNEDTMPQLETYKKEKPTSTPSNPQFEDISYLKDLDDEVKEYVFFDAEARTKFIAEETKSVKLEVSDDDKNLRKSLDLLSSQGAMITRYDTEWKEMAQKKQEPGQKNINYIFYGKDKLNPTAFLDHVDGTD